MNKSLKWRENRGYLFLLTLPASDDRRLSPSSSSLLTSPLFFAYTNRQVDMSVDKDPYFCKFLHCLFFNYSILFSFLA